MLHRPPIRIRAPGAVHYGRALPSTGRQNPRSFELCCEHSCRQRFTAERTKKRRSFTAPPFPWFEQLLNRDDALHVEREVRHTMIGILAWLDVAERDGDRVARVHFHVAGELSH